MGVAVANVALGGRIQAVTDRASFDEAIAAALQRTTPGVKPMSRERNGGDMRFEHARRTCLVTLLAGLGTGCGRDLPEAVKPTILAQRGAAIELADAAARVCPQAVLSAPFQPNPMAAPALPGNPAVGTALANDPHVLDVIVSCSWPDPRDPSGETWGGTSLPRLHDHWGPPVRVVTMPEDFIENTCKGDAKTCEQLIVPSRHHEDASSADLRIVRPTEDGGVAEVTVVFVPTSAPQP